MNSTIKYLLALTILFGCKKATEQPVNTDNVTQPAVPGEKKITYLALGDSYTIGQSVPGDENFPNQLAARLDKDKKINVKEVKIIAMTGWTTTNLRQAIDSEDPHDNYSLVTLLIGVNDQYQGKDTTSYAVNFEALLNRAVQLAGNKNERVCVVSIPDYGFTPFGAGNKEKISAEIDRFNAINKRITDLYGITYFDITPVSRNTDPSLVASDGLHPSARQYGLWVDLMYTAVRAKLGS